MPFCQNNMLLLIQMIIKQTKTELKRLLLSTIIFAYAPFAENKNRIIDTTARIFQTLIPGLPSVFTQQLSSMNIPDIYTYRATLSRTANSFCSQALGDYNLNQNQLSACHANLADLKSLTTEDSALQSLFSNAILGIEEKRINTTKTLLAYLKYKESLYSLVSSPEKIEELRAKPLNQLTLTIDSLDTSDKELFFKLIGFNKDSIPRVIEQVNPQLYQTIVISTACSVFKQKGITTNTITYEDIINTPRPKNIHEFQTLLTKIGFMSPEQYQLFLEYTKVENVKLSDLQWRNYAAALPDNEKLEKQLTAAILYTEGKATQKVNSKELDSKTE